ncbi:hypothetical protein BVRB_9g211660 [Beta vulgaris subsp. vulgaris]|nr:hypothetical protein BVRB_9g211660 [Beta vulgaris subsp. vulgaris]
MMKKEKEIYERKVCSTSFNYHLIRNIVLINTVKPLY